MTEDTRAATPTGDDEPTWVAELLSHLDQPAMPPEVWTRLESRLTDLSDARALVSGQDPHPVPAARHRRRIGTLLGGVAAACAALLVGGLAVQSAVTSSPAPPLAPPPVSSALTTTSALAVLHTRTAYTSDALPGQMTQVLADAGLSSTEDVRRALRRAESVRIPTLASTGFTSAHPAIAACVRAVADALGLATPAVLIDRGTLDGAEVGLVVFESPVDRELTVAVVEPTCDPASPVTLTVRVLLP